VRYADLTKEQRVVLLNVVEQSFLWEVMNECATGADWPDRAPYIPHLTQVVLDFFDKGLASLYTYSDDPDNTIIYIPDDEARIILANPDNWWSPGNFPSIALMPTDKGLALHQGDDVAIDRLQTGLSGCDPCLMESRRSRRSSPRGTASAATGRTGRCSTDSATCSDGTPTG
jgi:hypothetical protein